MINENTNPTPRSPGTAYGRSDSHVIDEDFGVRIYKSPASRSWYVQYVHPAGGQRRQSLKVKSKKEAENRAKDLAAKLRLGMTDGVRATKKDIAIEEAAKLMLARLKAKGRDEKTLEIYDRGLAQLAAWGKNNGATKLSHLTPARLAEYESALRTTVVPFPSPTDQRTQRRGRPNTPCTIRGKIQLITTLIRWAVRQKHLGEHPCPHYELPAAPRRERPIYTAEDLRLIMEDPDAAAREAWQLFRVTGVRAGELCWFTKDDVCQQPWGLHVRAKTCPLTGEFWRPKQAKSRFVPVTDPDAIALLKRRLETPGPWLLTDEQGRRWTNSLLLNRLCRRRKQTGIKHANLHMFRHTVATFLANNPAVPLTHVQKFLGHADIKVTMGYVHTQAGDVQQSVARVSFSAMVAPVTSRDPQTATDPGSEADDGSSKPPGPATP